MQLIKCSQTSGVRHYRRGWNFEICLALNTANDSPPARLGPPLHRYTPRGPSPSPADNGKRKEGCNFFSMKKKKIELTNK